MNRAFIQPGRFLAVVAVIGLAFGFVGWRLWDLQVARRAELREQALETRQRLQVLRAQRGKIVDTHGNLMASTKSVVDIGVDPVAAGEAERAAAPQIAEILGISEAEVLDALEGGYRTVTTESGAAIPRKIRWVELADAASEEMYEAVKALGLDAVYGNRRFTRYYPNERLAAHVLGFLNEGGYALGVEHAMDYYLRGQDGWREIEHDGRRREVFAFRSREVEPREGYHVELSLDLVIQYFADQELRRLVQEYDPKGISILVSEVGSGRIRALATYPDFDPNNFGAARPEHYRNRTLTDIYEPGSTFKIVSTAATLDAGLVNTDTEYDCSKPILEWGGRTYRLPRDDHKMEELSVSEILYKSSNRGAAFLGVLLGRDGLYRAAQDFGFGEPTGVFLSAEVLPLRDREGKGEIGGILHHPDDWDGLTITRLPMGHAVSATPLQVHAATGVVANGGKWYQPRVVERVFDDSGNTILRFNNEVSREVLSRETAGTVAEILAKVVRPGGTARRARVDGLGCAGKTGTTKKIEPDGTYSYKRHVASFSGFFPYQDPRLVITVVVDEPKMKDGIPGYGGVVAAPAFRNLAQRSAQYLGIPLIYGETQEELVARRDDS
ncbi:MAG: peptidoglycan D,D-transpeptidase FtsI family protein [Opitutales bacterium]